MKIALTALACSGFAACGGPTTAPHKPEHDLDLPLVAKAAEKADPDVPFTRLDPMLDLTIADDAWEGTKLSWVHPLRASLEVGGSPIDSGVPNAPPVPTTILDRRGNSVRLAVRLENARFSLWTDKTALLAIVQKDVRLVEVFNDGKRDVHARLNAGAYAERVEKRPNETKVRYIADIEMEGWLPDDFLGDTGGERSSYRGHLPSGTKQVTAMRGSEIYAEPRWGSTRLAVVNSGYMLDQVDKLDDNWLYVAWKTGSADVAGYYRQFSAPGSVHSQQVDPDAAPAPIVPNTRVASGTCLYARANGEAIGFLVGDQEVQLDPTNVDEWPTLAIDTPWGAILFRVHGHDAQDFATCVPANTTVPQSVLNVAPPAP